MKLLNLITTFVLLFPAAIKAQPSPKPADEVLKQAFQQADKESKNVFVIFHASWCILCRKLDGSMNDAACKNLFSDNYVIRHLVIYESKGKENLENPGAVDLITKYKGNDLGIPYWLVFDKEGKLLADSKIRPEGGGLDTGINIGCPSSKKEVTYFLSILRKTSKLDSDQLEVIRKRFRENESVL